MAFTWTAGLIGGRVTSETLLGKTPESFPLGFRRAHGKGICYAGTFRSSGAAVQYSTAHVFSQLDVLVIGLFSIGTGDPHVADISIHKFISIGICL